MIRRPFVLLALMALGPSPSAPAAAAAHAPDLHLAWERLPDLPDPVGLKGMYGGVSGDRVLLAGGSNFPVPSRTGGRKTFHATIFHRPVRAGVEQGWERAAAGLPAGLGEGASVTALDGVVCLGGHDGTGPVANVFLLRWNAGMRQVNRIMLPDLPEPAANAAASVLGTWLYVAGGEGRAGVLAAFRRLDLTAAARDPGGARWQTLRGWPGPPRFGGVLVPVSVAGGDAMLWAGGIQGPARSQADYLRDAYLYRPDADGWSRVADLPRGVVLGAGIAAGPGRVLLLGGSDGHDFARMKELGAAYRIPDDVLLYDTGADRWRRAGTMPLGLVGATIVRTGEGWLVAGGEYSPGLRTPQVHRLSSAEALPGKRRPAQEGAR